VALDFAALPDYDELHVISDLHLGGRPGFQIFGSTAELVWLIDELRQRQPPARVALVINGDFIDFLAQAPALPFDPEGAAAKLAAIAADPAFLPIFDALRRYTASDRCELLVNLGNHDLELSLPWVQDALLTLLSGGERTARGRITLAFDGSGIGARVGGARVLCVHGNEVDAWNVADYERMRRIGRDLIQGRVAEPWVPNGGSQLVCAVMNRIKQRYPFVDLLKPEGPAVFPTLVALDPTVVSELAGLAPAAARSGWDAVRMGSGLLAATAAPASATAQPGSSGAGLRVLRRQREELARELLDRTESRWREGATALDLVGSDQRAEYIGIAGGLAKLFAGKGKAEALREALDGLDADTSFDPAAEDDTYRELDTRMGGEIDFLIAGHTHLERALKRRRGRGYYFNCGTWARLIRIVPALRQDPGQFSKLFERLQAGSMAALDGNAVEPGVTLRHCSVVSIWRDAGSTWGELRHVVPSQAAPNPCAFHPVDKAKFPVG